MMYARCENGGYARLDTGAAKACSCTLIARYCIDGTLTPYYANGEELDGLTDGAWVLDGVTCVYFDPADAVEDTTGYTDVTDRLTAHVESCESCQETWGNCIDDQSCEGAVLEYDVIVPASFNFGNAQPKPCVGGTGRVTLYARSAGSEPVKTGCAVEAAAVAFGADTPGGDCINGFALQSNPTTPNTAARMLWGGDFTAPVPCPIWYTVLDFAADPAADPDAHPELWGGGSGGSILFYRPRSALTANIEGVYRFLTQFPDALDLGGTGDGFGDNRGSYIIVEATAP